MSDLDVMFGGMEVDVTVRLPRRVGLVRFSFRMPDYQAKALKQTRMREDIARDMAQGVAEKIVAAVDSQDTQHGFSPEEWTRMNRAR